MDGVCNISSPRDPVAVAYVGGACVGERGDHENETCGGDYAADLYDCGQPFTMEGPDWRSAECCCGPQ